MPYPRWCGHLLRIPVQRVPFCVHFARVELGLKKQRSDRAMACRVSVKSCGKFWHRLVPPRMRAGTCLRHAASKWQEC